MDKLIEYQFVVVLMMCLMTESCCCCFSLEVGAQVISFIVTMLSAALLVLYVASAVLVKMSQVKLIFYSCMALLAGLQCMTGILLGYGAFQQRPKLMHPWLMIAGLTGPCLLALSLAGFMWFVLTQGYIDANSNLTIFAYVIYSLFLIYCCYVVNSRRLELVKEKKQYELIQTLMTPPLRLTNGLLNGHPGSYDYQYAQGRPRDVIIANGL